MKEAPKSFVDSLITAAIAFGLGIPTSVNEQLKENEYEQIAPEIILKRAEDILAERALFDELINKKQ